jgi:TonB family protein
VKIRRVVAEYLVRAIVAALLSVWTLALGQGTMEKVPDGESKANEATRGNPHLRQLMQVGEMEVLSDSMGLDFTNYLRVEVLPNIRQNWRRVLDKNGFSPVGERKSVAIDFTILRNGSVDNIKLAQSSGDSELDGVALDSAMKSAPFPALPTEFSGQQLEVRCHFFVNPGRMIAFVNSGAHGSGSDAAVNIPPVRRTLRINDGVVRPRVVYSPAPEYSEKARKAKLEGTVVLKVTVNESGDVADVKVVKGLGSGLDEKAVEAVRSWKFKPGTKDGTPVQSEIAVETSFHLY